MMALDPVINVYPASSGNSSGWFVLLGAVAGGVLAFATAFFSDRRKLEREDDRRWNDDLVRTSSLFIESVAGLVAATATMQNALQYVAEPVGMDKMNEALDLRNHLSTEALKKGQEVAKRRSELREPVDEAQALMQGRRASLMIIAPREVTTIAQELESSARGMVQATGQDRKALRIVLEEQLESFTGAVARAMRKVGKSKSTPDGVPAR